MVEFLKADDCSVMLGIPSFWREQNRDTVDDPQLHELLKLADVLSPWSVGRYRNPDEAKRQLLGLVEDSDLLPAERLAGVIRDLAGEQRLQ